MADLSSISKYITKGKESQAQSIAKSGGHSIYGGGSSGGGGSNPAPYQGTDQAGFVNYLAQNNILTDNTAAGIAKANKVVSAANIGQTAIPLIAKPDLSLDYSSIVNQASADAQYQTQMDTNEAIKEGESQTPGVKAAESYLNDAKQFVPEAPTDNTQNYLDLEKKAGLQDLRATADEYTRQINSVLAGAQADIQSIRNQSSVEGGTVGILSAREDAINRSAAIKVLPLQAAQAAAQGALDRAEERVRTLSDLMQKDNQAQYEYKIKVGELAREFMTRDQEKQYNAKLLQDTRIYNEKQSLIDYQSQVAMELAKNGQGAYIPLVYQQTDRAGILKAVGSKLSTTGSIKTQVVKREDGSQALINSITGEVIKEIGISQNDTGLNTKSESKIDSLQAKVTLIDNVMNSPAMDSVVGPTALSRAPFGKWEATKRIAGSTAAGAAAGAGIGFTAGGVGAIPGSLIGGGVGLVAGVSSSLQGSVDKLTGADDTFIAGVEQLISKEFLDSLIDVKSQGAVFGSLQKAEQDALTNAASRIGFWRITQGSGDEAKVVGYDAPESEFRAELKIIQDYANKKIIQARGTVIGQDEQEILNSAFDSTQGLTAGDYY